MRDIITLNSKVVELSSLSSNTKEIKMYVHTVDEENANGLTFTLSSTETYKDTLINKPVVVRMTTDESDFKGHEPIYDKDGNIVKLDTIAVGTITDAWIEDREINNETKKALMAKATIWSYKFPTVVDIMENLLSEGNLDTSVEVAIFSYTDDSLIKHRKTDQMEYLSNCMLGSMILPADSNAGVVEMFYREVAQALNNSTIQVEPPQEGETLDININSQEGGQVMDKPNVELFNLGYKIKFHGSIENCTLSYEDISNQIYILLNYDADGNYVGGYWIQETFSDHVIIEDWENDISYSVDYTVAEDKVSIVSKNEWIKGDYVFTPDSQASVTEVQTENESLKTQLNEVQSQVTNLQEQLNTKDQALQLNEQTANEKIISLGQVVDELKTKLNEVQPLIDDYNHLQQEKVEQELNTKRENLKKVALASKRIEEKELTENQEIAEAIQKVDESKIKQIIADRVIAMELESVNNSSGDIIISTQQPEDLLPGSVKDHMYAPKNKRN